MLIVEETTTEEIAAHLKDLAILQMGQSKSRFLTDRCSHTAELLVALRCTQRHGEPSGDDTQTAVKIDAARDFISANLPVLPVPSIPEIHLHTARPQSGLWRLADQDQEFGSPYWAHYWSGGLVLARYLLDRPNAVAGRRMLDLGAGSGVVGIAAAKAGAAEVIAADIDPYALTAVALNGAINEVTIIPVLADLTKGAPPAIDIICVGDLFYESALAERVTAFLDCCLQEGIEVLIGDPWRAHLPRSRLRLLAEYAVPDFGDVAGGSRPSGVFAFEGKTPQQRQGDKDQSQRQKPFGLDQG